MKILITGGSGFVGRYFQEYYKEHDITVVDIDHPFTANWYGDCRDFFKYPDSYQTHYDLVIHLAAIVGGRKTIEGNPLSVATDLSIDSDFFQWVLRARPGRVVYFSSSAAYPIDLQTSNSGIKLAEHHLDLNAVRNPDLTYGWAKLTGEYLAEFVKAEGIKVHVFRPFSGYGTDQDLSYPFPMYIKRAKNRQNPFEIWGDGTQVRDFIHMTDVVRAVDAAIQQNYLEPLNLGSGIATSFNELAALVTEKAGYNPDFKHLPAEPVGVMYRVSNNSNMLKVYTPKIDLERGVEMALAGELW
jgi:nucleoside-diphosphate-sugar epimerase